MKFLLLALFLIPLFIGCGHKKKCNCDCEAAKQYIQQKSDFIDTLVVRGWPAKKFKPGGMDTLAMKRLCGDTSIEWPFRATPPKVYTSKDTINLQNAGIND